MNSNAKTYFTVTGTMLPAFALAAAYYMGKNKDWCMFKDQTALVVLAVGAVAGYMLTQKLLKA